MKIGKYFTLEEFIVSQSASRLGLDNTPDDITLTNIEALCTNVLDPIREKIGAPIIISSGYRSPALNKAIGGSAASQHCLGKASDIWTPKMNTDHFFRYIMTNMLDLVYDQIILEFGQWIHNSYNGVETNRGMKLKADRINGKVVYSNV